MNAIILAGGRASRMGSCDKAFLKIGRNAIIKRQLKILKEIFKEIFIVTNSPNKYRNVKEVSVITDTIPHQGPLGGIYSGLMASDSFYNFVVACDMPFINGELIKYMIKNKDGYDVIIPKIDKKRHPLFGIYSKDCIHIIEKMLKDGRLKISNMFPKVKTHFILKKVAGRFDKKILSLININTKEDLAEANFIYSNDNDLDGYNSP